MPFTFSRNIIYSSSDRVYFTKFVNLVMAQLYGLNNRLGPCEDVSLETWTSTSRKSARENVFSARFKAKCRV